MMREIIPNLWFSTHAEEAAKFYASLFSNSSVGTATRYDKASAEVSGQPEGSAMTVEFELAGQKFLGLNGGPQFSFNPSISFIVNCPTKGEVDELWEKLSDGGKVLMPLDSYPFSDRYGWVQDKYGLSWQLILSEGNIEQKIIPSIMFVGNKCGKAEEAINFYTSVFDNAKPVNIIRYEANAAPQREGTVMFADFKLEDQLFAAMDSALDHDFTFNEAISFIVDCKDQNEVDYFWEKFTQDGEEGPCGWLKDAYGVSWQIVPKQLTDLLKAEDKEKAGRVMESMLQMKKIDIGKLEKAYKGK